MQPSTFQTKLSLDEYLGVRVQRYEACLDTLPKQGALDSVVSTVRFHHFRLDGNGRPKCEVLAKNVAFHILNYCFNTRKRASAVSDDDVMELRDEAKQFFRDEKRSGEAGEMLLYFIMEAALKAPQMVSKISLKTNPQVETFGSDGVHMKWHEHDQMLDIYFGEAKLYQDFAAAAKSAAESIGKFHANSMEEFELRLVNRHFKHADGKLKDEVLKYVQKGTTLETVRVNHACLLGYNSTHYDALGNGTMQEMIAAMKRAYEIESLSIIKTLNERFGHFEQKRLRFEVIILPFQSVEQFSTWFQSAL